MGCCTSVPETNSGQAKVGQNGTANPGVATSYNNCNNCDFWSTALDPKTNAFDDEDDSVAKRLSSADQILKLKAEETGSRDDRANGVSHFREDTANIEAEFLNEPGTSTSRKDTDTYDASYPLDEAPAQAPYALKEEDILLDYDQFGTPVRPRPEEEEDADLDQICKSCESIVSMKRKEQEELKRKAGARVPQQEPGYP
eukprot:CAMPEP_0118941656 /NCGR_PEP_ID=MMETSP1169-20130426/34372_1 /TAXON_ID=36882 /ORGANISM="Pyramimonas obovata, Strain CCMP722" /LENGTH=198 /DNA_ID=CAMNT_0006886469 /DNA_START=214 /DNA_END=807 /DNA_ORIENTATION=+